MRPVMKRMAALAVMLSATGTAAAQQATVNKPPPTTGSTTLLTSPVYRYGPMKKSGLETALDEALKANPDLRVAAAKVSQAEAELAQVRLQVVRKVVAAYQTAETAKNNVTLLTAQLKRLQD